ncbi:hypothetical protein LEL86_08130 [Streptomyces sp. WA6-1-16]|uniref:hypothetical protein n=1 Tax=Streptomyces sp. WA6-1-16 TaxID=2879427 RepID=UPI000A227090|nr:hypothetical protein [Streptomyces sp. WA6-1-16]OSC74661.1 hypothetical protein B5180_11695 [Streptomyces sp. BF-3]UCA49245.1 hypothetical protein LEL86_08130 [Streptomyces sp. WA6-1-16]
MAHLFIFGCFLLLGIASSLAARSGYRGTVCDRSVGYGIPAEVASDPALRSRANSLVAFWCTGAAILSLAPLVALGSAVLRNGGTSVSTGGLVAFAAYGLVVVTVGAYPFETIKQLGSPAER